METTDPEPSQTPLASAEMVTGGEQASCIRCGLCLATCPVLSLIHI